MAIKEVPINIRVYYKNMINYYNKQLNEANSTKNKLIKTINVLHDDFLSNYNEFKDKFNIELNDYEEFVENKYITGKFYKVAKGLFINRNNNYELVSDLYDLYLLSTLQKRIHILNENIKFYEKLVNIDYDKYREILKFYYTEVHKKLILEGLGYAFSGRIGWICINRCIIKKQKSHIDFVATKKRENELKAKGIRIYNKEEAEWCKKNGIEYKAEDKRVFLKNEHCYEIPLINCTLTNGNKIKFVTSDYRPIKYRNRTNNDIIEECDGDINKICELNIDFRTKLNICDKCNKTLYTKFIRNENQESTSLAKAARKNR